MVTNEIRPYKCNAHDSDKSFDPFDIPHMRILDVEPGRFHGAEERLNLPSVLICRHGIFRPVEADEDLKFGVSIEVLESCCSGKIDILPFIR